VVGVLGGRTPGAVDPAEFNDNVLAFLIPEFPETFSEGFVRRSRRYADIANVRNFRPHRRLLRPRPEWPRCCSAAEQCDELAALHSNTSLARAANAFDIETPRRTAALRLIAMWNRVACSIGRSV